MKRSQRAYMRAQNFKKLEIVEAFIQDTKQDVAVVGVEEYVKNGEKKYRLEAVTFGGSHHKIEEFEEDSNNGNFLNPTEQKTPVMKYKVDDLVKIWAYNEAIDDAVIIRIDTPDDDSVLNCLAQAPDGGNYWVAENKDLDGDWFIMEKM